jgi:hypothetical protein
MLRLKLAEEKREKELLRLRKLTPEERLKAQIQHNARIKRLFFAGLNEKAFSRGEILRLWKEK